MIACIFEMITMDSSSLIESKELDCWNAMPFQRFNRHGQLDNNGSIHLAGLLVHFDAEATAIITEIDQKQVGAFLRFMKL